MKFPSASPLQLLLCACLSAIGSCSSEHQHPLMSSNNGEASHDDVVSTYKAIFSNWAQDRISFQDNTAILVRSRGSGRNHSHNTPDALCSQPDFCDPGCGCIQGFFVQPSSSTKLPISSTTGAIPAASSIVVSLVMKAAAMLLPGSIPNIASEIPARTTLVPGTAKPKVMDETTESFYNDAITGQYKSVIPLILTDNTGTPITILSFANASHHSSFISASLLDQLDLTSQITTSTSPPTDITDITSLMGYPSTSIGSINLNIIAGHSDLRLANQIFTVFAPLQTAEYKQQQQQQQQQPHVWQRDVVVGLDFLNDAGALRLSDEFYGVAAKEGLGVVVQKVVRGVPDVVRTSAGLEPEMEGRHAEL